MSSDWCWPAARGQVVGIEPQRPPPAVLGPGLGRQRRAASQRSQFVGVAAWAPIAGPELVAQRLQADELLVLDLAVVVGDLADRVRSVANRSLGLGMQLVDSPVPCLGARAVHVARV